MPNDNSKIFSTHEYTSFLESIKTRIRESRIAAYRSVNRELIALYWQIGKEISERQDQFGWGKSIVEKLSCDLRVAFPGSSGFSARNLWNMRRFYVEYSSMPNLQQLVAEIPWGQNLLILAKISDNDQRAYYLQKTLELGWSRNVLLHMITSNAYARHNLADKQHNFSETLPQVLAEQADEAMKDVYALDFLGITRPVLERELEKRMVNQIRDVLLEFGHGFTFIGNQYNLKLEEQEYFIDLLFFHRKLSCLVAVELKIGEFKPEYAGKMNFYLNLLNDHVREPHENPSIGIILCGDKNRLVVEYALRGMDKPMGVAKYTLTNTLPDNLKDKLPNARELERKILEELGGQESDEQWQVASG